MNRPDDIGDSMLPFVIKDLTSMVMQKKSMTMEDALHYIYSSDLYRSLLDKESKTWYLSTISLYELLEKGKAAARKKEDNNQKILMFKIFCIENYRQATGITANETLVLFAVHGVFGFLDETFEMLHTQDTGYILDSIKNYIKKTKAGK